MTLGPLEYVVIGLEDHPFADAILPILGVLQEQGGVRVVDLLFVTKDAAGAVAVREVRDLDDAGQDSYRSVLHDLGDLLTADDIDILAAEVPTNAAAVILLLEHTWALELTDAVKRAGGLLVTGGLIPPDNLQQIRAEVSASAAAR